MNIRITKELAELIRETAIHCGKNDSDIIRAAFNSFLRWSESVVHISVDNVYYKSGNIVKTVRGIGNVDDPEKFKKHLAERCLLELRKPKRTFRMKYPALPAHAPVTMQEALQMECYIDEH